MTDQIVEFCNALVSKDELEAGFDIAATAAGETAIIREVSIQSRYSLPFRLNIDGADVAASKGSSVLAGSEVVKPESSLKLLGQTSGPMNGIDYFAPSLLRYESKSLFGTPDGALFMNLVGGDTISSALTGSMYFACFDAAGNFYYGDPYEEALYKRAGGVNGTQTSFSLGFCQVYDGSRYIYAVNSSSILRRFDTQTGTIDGTGSAAGFSRSYGRVAEIDGYMIVRKGFAEVDYLVGNPVTGAVKSFKGYTDNSGQRYFLQAGKNSSGDYIVVTTSSAQPNLHWYDLGPDLANPSVRRSGAVDSGINNNPGDWNQIFRHPEDSSKLFYLNHYNYLEFDLNTLSWSGTVTLTGMATTPRVLVPRFDAARASADFEPVRVRATGILSREAV